MTKSRIEHKAVPFEWKADPSNDYTFEGYGAVCGNVDLGDDIIRQGAFTDTLSTWRSKGKWPKMLWQHDTEKPIGVWTDMSEDSHGLHCKGRLTKGVRCSDEAYALMKDGAIDGMSIGYRTIESDYDRDLNVRSLIKLDLMEVSIVTFPMNPAADITNVKTAHNVKTIREFEDFLRDVGGYSNAAAKAIAARGFKSSEPRDEDGAASGLLDAIRKIKAGLPA